MDEISLGTKIRTIRTLRGLYQADLAEKTGINRPTIVAIERGDVVPGEAHKKAIEAALGIQLDTPEVKAAFTVLANVDDELVAEYHLGTGPADNVDEAS